MVATTCGRSSTRLQRKGKERRGRGDGRRGRAQRGAVLALQRRPIQQARCAHTHTHTLPTAYYEHAHPLAVEELQQPLPTSAACSASTA